MCGVLHTEPAKDVVIDAPPTTTCVQQPPPLSAVDHVTEQLCEKLREKIAAQVVVEGVPLTSEHSTRLLATLDFVEDPANRREMATLMMESVSKELTNRAGRTTECS